MANMIMASSKSPITSTSSAAALRTPMTVKLNPVHLSFPKLPLPQFPKPHQLLSFSKPFPSFSQLPSPSPFFPSRRNQKGVTFRLQFDPSHHDGTVLASNGGSRQICYTPFGKFMDERDAAIKESLSSVKDTSKEVKQLKDEAVAIMSAARAEICAALNKMKKEGNSIFDLCI